MNKIIFRVFIFAVALAGISGLSFAENEECFEQKEECLEYIREAAEGGGADAQYKLGRMYGKGEGVEKDYSEALRWFRKSAEQGNAKAQHGLGVMYYNGWGIEKDYSEALRWYRRSAEQGNAKAQHNLGLMYYKGHGIEKDYRKAARWIHKAAEQGEAFAQVALGFAYQNGNGVEENDREAVRWYRKAAEQGNAQAQFNLGWMYYEGEGVVEDKSRAYIWYLIAKAGGSESADKNLRVHLWARYLTSADIKSAKREAARRLETIENRKNNAESFDNNSARESGANIAIGKPPEETNIAAQVFENTWRSIVMVKDNDGQGSGVIIRPNLVATNCHVVENGGVFVYKAENQKINEDTSFSAKIIHYNEEHDFCVLEVKGLWGIPATIRKYDTLKIGENVYALGAPRGLDMSLSDGLISQFRSEDDLRFIQTNADISPGSSGGGLFDTKGNLIGITTSKYADEETEGIGFAIPADLILEF